jgi:hypothetical protein
MNTDVKKRITVFTKGFASAFDLSGFALVEHREILGGFERDRIMLRGDWIRVGNDVKKAMNMVAHEQG